jgi:hypothetical protein
LLDLPVVPLLPLLLLSPAPVPLSRFTRKDPGLTLVFLLGCFEAPSSLLLLSTTFASTARKARRSAELWCGRAKSAMRSTVSIACQ